MPQPKTTEGPHPAVKALQDEIAAIESGQAPTRAQIAELEASLREGEEVIARNRQAIAVIEGRAAAPSASPRRRTRSGASGPSAGEIDANRVISFLGGNPGSYANDIATGLGLDVEGKTPQGLTVKLSELVEAGTLTREGERRWTKYSVTNG